MKSRGLSNELTHIHAGQAGCPYQQRISFLLVDDTPCGVRNSERGIANQVQRNFLVSADEGAT